MLLIYVGFTRLVTLHQLRQSLNNQLVSHQLRCVDHASAHSIASKTLFAVQLVQGMLFEYRPTTLNTDFARHSSWYYAPTFWNSCLQLLRRFKCRLNF